MFDNKSTRIKTQAPTPVDELFFCPVTVCIDIWLRLSSYKQLVFHILYLHRFNILKIVTFNKLPCFMQPKSSKMHQFSFSFLKLQSKSTHGFCHFIKCTIHLFHHHRHKYHYYQKKNSSHLLCHHYQIELSAVSHVAARYRATLCFAVDTLSPFH